MGNRIKELIEKYGLDALRSARDARIGAVGAEEVRRLASEGKVEEAKNVSQKLLGANLIGIAGGVGGNAMLSSPSFGVGASQFAKRMAVDIPAFEAVDRIPTLWNDPRLTVQGGNVLESGYRAVVPDGRFEDVTAPYINTAGQFITGALPASAGDAVMRGLSRGAGALYNSIKKVPSNTSVLKNPETGYNVKITEDPGVPENANGYILKIGREDDAAARLKGDTVSYKLADAWLEEKHPDLYKDMLRFRRRDLGEELMKHLEFTEKPSKEMLDDIASGRFSWLGAGTPWFERQFKLRPKYNSPEAIKYIESLGQVSGEPFRSRAYFPSSAAVEFGSFLRPSFKARDAAYELMTDAVKQGKLSPRPINVSTAGPDGRPVFTGTKLKPVELSDVKYPYIHFSGKSLDKSAQYHGVGSDHLYIGLGDMLDGSVGFVNNPYGIGMQMHPIENTVAHEVGHGHPSYNTRLSKGAPDILYLQSPYYGNNYEGINTHLEKALVPDKSVKIDSYDYPHDFELSENFSDILGARTLFKLYGINNGSEPYTAAQLKDFNSIFKDKFGDTALRFQQLHPNTENQLWLLNNAWAKGGKIHIKPENRGKFTALKKRTGHSASWFKAHGTPAQKKMATFALNARKWKHADGGQINRTDRTALSAGGLIEKYGTDAIRKALLNKK